MTKSQLLAALAPLPDDAQVFIAVVPDNNSDLLLHVLKHEKPGFGCGTTTQAKIYDADGPDAPAFACIEWSY